MTIYLAQRTGENSLVREGQVNDERARVEHTCTRTRNGSTPNGIRPMIHNLRSTQLLVGRPRGSPGRR